MKFTLEIACDNSAFVGDGEAGALEYELGRILSELGDKLMLGHTSLQPGSAGPLRDINGNNVGGWRMDE